MEGLPTPQSLYEESCKNYDKISKQAMEALKVSFIDFSASAAAKGLFSCSLKLPELLLIPKFTSDVLIAFRRAGFKTDMDRLTNTITVDWSCAIPSIRNIPTGFLPDLIPIDQVNK